MAFDAEEREGAGPKPVRLTLHSSAGPIDTQDWGPNMAFWPRQSVNPPYWLAAEMSDGTVRTMQLGNQEPMIPGESLTVTSINL